MAVGTQASVIPNAPSTKRTVFYEGTAALTKGTILNYDKTTGTATVADGSRGTTATNPSKTNNYGFAGVLVNNVNANLTGLPVPVDIITEGWVYALVTVSVSIGQLVGAICDSPTAANVGCFGHPVHALKARGSAWARQTVTVSSAPVMCLVELVGEEGDEESGEIQEYTPAAGGGAVTDIMIGGTTVFNAATIAANITNTLADGLFFGMKKRLVLAGAMTTSAIVITTTHAKAPNGITMDAIATVTLSSSGYYFYVTFDGTSWILDSCLVNSST